MLYFSKLRITLVFFVTLFFILVSFSNFSDSKFNFISKKINLGLDLQGGSYLLLEIDNDPVQIQKLQNTLSAIRNFLKQKKIDFYDLRINDKEIKFNVSNKDFNSVNGFFLNKESEINPYYDQYKSHQFDISSNINEFTLKLSKFGLIEIKNSSQDQAI